MTGKDIKPNIEMPPLPTEEPIVEQTEQIESPQEVNQEALAVEAKPAESPFAKASEDRPTKQELNFKQLREQKERAERERDELIKLLNQKQAVPDEEDIALKPDDLVEGKHFNKKVKKLEAQLQQYQQQTEMMAIENQIKSQYPDFDKVVSKENIELLKEQYPELAATLSASTDFKSKAIAAYTTINKLIVPAVSYEADRNKAQLNASKPKPLAAVGAGDSPMSRANAFASGLTDELRASLLKEMNESRKGY